MEHCFGLPLWRGRKHYVELWCCFSGVRPHAHPGQHVEIVPLWGWATFSRAASRGSKVQSVVITPWRWFAAFSIPAGWPHWFTLRRRPLVFLNIATGRQSAAENFVT